MDFPGLGRIEQALQALVTIIGSLFNRTQGAGLVVSYSASTALATAQVSVSTSATLIRAANADRKFIQVYNTGANPVFIGASGVTTATGLRVPAGAPFTMDNNVTTAAIYGVVAAATETVGVIEW